MALNDGTNPSFASHNRTLKIGICGISEKGRRGQSKISVIFDSESFLTPAWFFLKKIIIPRGLWQNGMPDDRAQVGEMILSCCSAVTDDMLKTEDSTARGIN